MIIIRNLGMHRWVTFLSIHWGSNVMKIQWNLWKDSKTAAKPKILMKSPRRTMNPQ